MNFKDCKKEVVSSDKKCSNCGNKIKSMDDLIEKIDDTTFEQVYHHTYKYVWRIAKSFFPENEQKQECEDCIQEIYMCLYKKRKEYDSERGEMLPWVKKIAKNICINKYHKYKKHCERTNFMEDHLEIFSQDSEFKFKEERIEFNPEAYMDKKEVSSIIRELLEALPTQIKQCILLYYSEQYNQKEIADILEIPVGTVKSRIHKGKKIIQEKVMALSKRGINLYGMSPIAFFVWLFVQESEAKAENIVYPGVGGFSTVSQQVAVKQLAEKGVKTVVSKSVITKVVVATIVILGLSVGGYYVSKQFMPEESLEEKQEVNRSEVKDSSTVEIPLTEKIDMDFISKILNNLSEYETISSKDVEQVITKIAKFQYSNLKDGFYNEDLYYLPNAEIIGIDKTEELGNTIPVDILYRKDAFNDIFELLGMTLDWNQMDPYDVSYVDDTSVGFVGTGLGGGYSSNVQINRIEGDENVKIYFTKEESFGNKIVHYDYCATIVPTETDLGYQIKSIQRDTREFEEKYQEIIKSYGNYFYKGIYSKPLTEEVIEGNQLGVVTFNYRASEEHPKIYYAFVDDDMDSEYELILTSDIQLEDALYDLWDIEEDEMGVNWNMRYYQKPYSEKIYWVEIPNE